MFYTTKTFTGINENYLEDIVVEASEKDPGLKGAMELVIENELNYNAIMKAIGMDEIRAYAESGTDVILESSVSGFFAKMREFFRKAYEKIKSLFKTFIAVLDSWIKNDSDFVKKYRSTLIKINTKDFSFKGYRFKARELNLSKAGDSMEKVLNDIGLRDSKIVVDGSAREAHQKAVRDWNSNKEDYIELLRGAALGESGKKYDHKEFMDKLTSKLRDGEDSPIEITNININEYLEIISTFKSAKKEAEDDFRAAEKKINEIIKSLNNQEKQITESLNSVEKDKQEAIVDAIRYASTASSAYKTIVNLLQTIQGAKMSAMKQENRQAKAVCVKLLRYKPKDESFAYSESSLLSGVVLK